MRAGETNMRFRTSTGIPIYDDARMSWNNKAMVEHEAEMLVILETLLTNDQEITVRAVACLHPQTNGICKRLHKTILQEF